MTEIRIGADSPYLRNAGPRQTEGISRKGVIARGRACPRLCSPVFHRELGWIRMVAAMNMTEARVSRSGGGGARCVAKSAAKGASHYPDAVTTLLSYRTQSWSMSMAIAAGLYW